MKNILLSFRIPLWVERNTLPLSFEFLFEKCVVIIDRFEIFLDRPILLKFRASTFSTYKSHNTEKYLIGITPQGFICFISLGYGGRCSDVFIVEDSNFLDNLKPGDLVLADRGFLIHEAAAFRANAEVKSRGLWSITQRSVWFMLFFW